MTRPSPAESQGGFTLIEMLITLTIFGFVALLASLGIHQATVSQVRLEKLENSARNIADLDAFLRGILSQAASPSLFRDPSVGAFDGDSERVSFLGPLRWGVDALDLVRYTLTFEPPGILRVRWALDGSLARGDDTTGERFLIEGVDAGNFAFLADGAEPAPENWSLTWQKPGELPRLVRVTLKKEGVVSDLVFALLRFRPPCKPDNSASQPGGAC